MLNSCTLYSDSTSLQMKDKLYTTGQAVRKGKEGKNWELVHQGKTWVYQHSPSDPNHFPESRVEREVKAKVNYSDNAGPLLHSLF